MPWRYTKLLIPEILTDKLQLVLEINVIELVQLIPLLEPRGITKYFLVIFFFLLVMTLGTWSIGYFNVTHVISVKDRLKNSSFLFPLNLEQLQLLMKKYVVVAMILMQWLVNILSACSFFFHIGSWLYYQCVNPCTFVASAVVLTRYIFFMQSCLVSILTDCTLNVMLGCAWFRRHHASKYIPVNSEYYWSKRFAVSKILISYTLQDNGSWKEVGVCCIIWDVLLL